ncbi:hypothetical protein AA0115_g3140 [Alternaria tenuissima]|uniref:Uncharacterized protein n=1 Tax=Alternaria tenuissima TaxID=119927 RepID=A0AB37WT81_9PLEO|nr:hypothetical protein AA0115_g3140 [Alternaria tenuissima]
MFHPVLVNALGHGTRVSNCKSVPNWSTACCIGDAAQGLVAAWLWSLNVHVCCSMLAVPSVVNAACAVVGSYDERWRNGSGVAPRTAPA